MRRMINGLVVLSMGAVVFSTVLAAQTMEQTVVETQARFAAWVDDVNEFVGDVRFDEGDLRSLLDNWEDFSAFGERLRAEAEVDSEEMPDIKEVLADDDYRDWAAQAGVDAEEWLRKSMRIFATTMRGQVLANMALVEEQLPAQTEMIESQREQMGEEMYEQMKQAMEMTLVTMKNMTETAARLPEPTDAERALLDKYETELTAAMMDDEDVDGD